MVMQLLAAVQRMIAMTTFPFVRKIILMLQVIYIMSICVYVNCVSDPPPPAEPSNFTHLYPTYPTHVGPGNVAVSLCVGVFVLVVDHHKGLHQCYYQYWYW